MHSTLKCFIMKETKLWTDSLMNYNCQGDFWTSLVVTWGRQSGIEEYCNYGGFEMMEVYTHGGQ
jgi:hypothetical protein